MLSRGLAQEALEECCRTPLRGIVANRTMRPERRIQCDGSQGKPAFETDGRWAVD